VFLLTEKVANLKEGARCLGGLAGEVRDFGGRTTLDHLRDAEVALLAARARLDALLSPDGGSGPSLRVL